MSKTVRILVVTSLVLLALGAVLYHLGTRQNLLQPSVGEEPLWSQSPGDMWLYAGGLMMLLSGSLGVAAVKIWLQGRRQTVACSLSPEQP